MLISDNIVLAVLSRGIVSKFVAVGARRQSIWNFYVDFIRSKNQVTNMDDVCKFFDFVVFYVYLHFYVLFVLCVCFFCVALVF